MPTQLVQVPVAPKVEPKPEVKKVEAPAPEKKPLDQAAVLAKIEAIEKTVGSIKGKISDLEAKKKSLADEEESVLLMVDSELNMLAES